MVLAAFPESLPQQDPRSGRCPHSACAVSRRTSQSQHMLEHSEEVGHLLVLSLYPTQADLLLSDFPCFLETVRELSLGYTGSPPEIVGPGDIAGQVLSISKLTRTSVYYRVDPSGGETSGSFS